MRCRNCGEEMPDRALVCGKCGTPVAEADKLKTEEDHRDAREEQTREPEPRAYYSAPGDGERTRPVDRRSTYSGDRVQTEPHGGREKMATAGLMTSLLAGILLLFPMGAIPVSIVGILLGALGCRSQFKTRAIVAIVLGIILLLTAMVLVIVQTMLAPYQDELIQLIYSQMGR